MLFRCWMAGILLGMALAIALPATVAAEEAGEEGGGEAAPAAWLEDHEEALKKAQEEGKLIIAHLTTERCGWCRKIENETYPDPRVQALLKQMVPLRIFLDHPGAEFGQELMKKAGARGVPTILMLDTDWSVIRYISGYKPPASFVEEVEKGLGSWKDYTDLKEKVGGDEVETGTIYRFVKAAHELKKTEDVRTYAEKGLEAEDGAHRADFAYYLASTYERGDEAYAKYREIAEEADPENEKGYLDEFIIGDAMAILTGIKRGDPEEAAKLAKAREILETAVGRESPDLDPEKGQVMYWILHQIHFKRGRGDWEKSIELLKKSIEMAPDTALAEGMKKRLDGIEKAWEKKKEKEAGSSSGGEEEE